MSTNRAFQPSVPSPKSSASSIDLFQKIILFLFHFLLFSVPLIFTWSNEELFEFPKMLLTYGATVLIVSAWLARMVVKQKVIFRKTPFDIPIAFFLISQMISTLLSIHPHTSMFGYYTRFHGGLLSFVCYALLFYAFVSNLHRRHLRGVFLTTFVSAFLVTLMAIPEHFGHGFTCLLINTSQKSLKMGPLSYAPSELLKSFDVSCWIQDVQNRVFATFGQPNWLAAYAIILIPLGISLSLNSEEDSTPTRSFSLTQFFYFAVTILLFMALLFTKSRSGVLGLGLGMAVYFGGLLWIRPKKIPQLSALLVALGVIAVFFGTPYTPSFKEFTNRVTGSPVKQAPLTETQAAPEGANRLEVGGTDSGEIRKIVWKGAVKVWQRYPIFGSGVETFAYSYYKDRPMEHNLVSEWDFLYNKAHNEFLNFLATTGIVGLLSYLLMLASFVLIPLAIVFIPKSVKEVSKKFPSWIHTSVENWPDTYSSSQKTFALSFAAGIIALSVSNFFGFSTVMVTILMFLFPAFFLQMVDEPQVEHVVVRKGDIEFSFTQLVGLGTISLSTLLLVFFTWNMWRADHIYTQGKTDMLTGHGDRALDELEKARRLSPSEGIFYDQLSLLYSQYAIAYAQAQDATSAGEFANLAQKTSDQLLEINPVHLNYYKSKTRVLISLAQLDPNMLNYAKENLKKAHELGPTDPKIMYNLAIIEDSLGESDQAFKDMKTTVEMKPNYAAARSSLAGLYEQRKDFDEAKKQYEYILKNIDPSSVDTKTKLDTLNAQIATMSTQKKSALPIK
jgi:putative inorganic carbon (HCO3(-)) transporter